jgi:hypothetical protein
MASHFFKGIGRSNLHNYTTAPTEFEEWENYSVPSIVDKYLENLHPGVTFRVQEDDDYGSKHWNEEGDGQTYYHSRKFDIIMNESYIIRYRNLYDSDTDSDEETNDIIYYPRYVVIVYGHHHVCGNTDTQWTDITVEKLHLYSD